jgi:hypothetical protein
MLDRPLLTSGRRLFLLAAAFVGLVAFIIGLVTDATRAWSVLLVNFLFWSGLGHAGVACSAIFHVTSARWARPLKRVAEATVAFLPASALMLCALLAGLGAWAPWMHESIGGRQVWLNAPLLIVRQVLGFLMLGGLSVAYVYASVRPDVGLLQESGRSIHPEVARRFSRGWRGLDTERRIARQRQSRLSVALLIVYGYVLSLQAFDFIMSLDREWFSALVGGYVFVGNLYMGVAFLGVAAVCLRTRLGLSTRVSRGQLYDIGRMLLGFCMLWGYLFWSQYLVIWFGDLPEETAFVAKRTVDSPWAPVSWVVLGGAFAVPFVMLLSREIKRRPAGLLTVAAIVLGSMWLERFILVAPSLWKGDHLPIGPLEVLVTAGVAALFALCYTAFLQRVPILPIADPLLASEAGR